MFKRILIFVSILLLSFSSQAQLIGEVVFEGNNKTKDKVLYDLISSREGTIFSQETIADDLNAVKSLHLFSDADYEIFQLDNGSIRIVFLLEEVFTIIPVVNLGGLSGDHAFWLTLGINEFNAFGNGDVLWANYTYFERHSFEVFYKNRKFRNTPLGLSSFASIKASIEPLYFVNNVTAFYNFTQWRVEELLTYYKSWNSEILFGGGFFREQYLLNKERTAEDNFDLVPQRVISDKVTVKSIYHYKKYDYFGHILEGREFSLGVDLIYNINERVFSDAIFTKWFAEVHNHIRYSARSNLSTRLFAGISTNNGSPFTSFVKDDYINARGVGDRSARGYSELTLNNEWRQTLVWKQDYYIQGVAFIDLNSIVPSRGRLIDLFNPDDIDVFVGLGIRLGLPKIYKTIVRADVSFNPKSNEISSIIFGLGQFF